MAGGIVDKHTPKVAMVTGGSGFIGSHVVRMLVEEGVSVRVLVRKGDPLNNLYGLAVELVEGDLLDRESIRQCMRGCDTVFHLAAVYAYWLPDPSLMYRVNIHGSRNLMEVALLEGVKKVVHTSSIAAVGTTEAESCADEATPFNDWLKADHYVMSKYIADLEVLRYASAGLDVSVVNPTFPFGENDIAPTPTGYLVQRYVSGKNPVWLPGGLNVGYVADIARGHLLAARHGRMGERYILGGHNITYREFGEKVCSMAGVAMPRFELNPNMVSFAGRINEWIADNVTHREPLLVNKAIQYMGYKYLYFDLRKAESELGYVVRPLEVALKESVEWFMEGREQRLELEMPAAIAAMTAGQAN